MEQPSSPSPLISTTEENTERSSVIAIEENAERISFVAGEACRRRGRDGGGGPARLQSKDASVLEKKRVAVVGGGPSGLISAHACLEAGLQPTVFEQSATGGGLWKTRERGGLTWPTLRTNLSKFTCAFSDAPWPPCAPLFPSSAEMASYLQDFSLTRSLDTCARFGLKVTSVRASSSSGRKGWVVKSCSTPVKKDSTSTSASSRRVVAEASTGGEERKEEGKEEEQEEGGEREEQEFFDFCIIATGALAKPDYPLDRGIFDATAARVRTIQACDYKGPEQHKGRRVLVVGNSFSGADIAAEVAEGGAESCVSAVGGTRQWFVPRMVAGASVSASPQPETPSFSSSPPPPPPTPPSRKGVMLPVDLRLYSRETAAVSVVHGADKAARNRSANARLERLVGQPGDSHPLLRRPVDCSPPFLAVADKYLACVKKGSIEVRQRLVDLRPDGTAIFQDGTTRADVQDIILCTGYSPVDLSTLLDKATLKTLEYDPGDRLQPLLLHHQTMHPDMPGLAFVGCYRGPYFATMELQARWAVRVFLGLVPPPTVAALTLTEATEAAVEMLMPTRFPV